MGPVGGLSLLGWTDVALDVGRDGVGRVPEGLVHDLGVGSGCQQKAGRGVPKGVQRDAAEADSLREDLEAPQHVAGLERCTDLGGEDQAVLLPGSGGGAPFLPLPGPVGLERLDGRAEAGHGPAGFVGLGLVDLQPLGCPRSGDGAVSRGVLREFIAAEKTSYGVRRLCRVFRPPRAAPSRLGW